MLFFNNMLKPMTGFEQSELATGKACSIAPHIVAEDRDKVAAVVKHACNEKEPFDVAYRFKHKNGDIRWFKEIGRPVFGPGDELLFVDGIITNITERKQAEKELRDESAFRKAVIERAAEGICVCHDIEGYPHVAFTVWNERAEEITGYTMDEINRLGWSQIMYPDPQLQQKAVERMERMRAGDDLVAEEWEITRKDGLTRMLAISTSVIVTEGDKRHVLALMHDITEEKKSRKQREDFLKSFQHP